MNFEEVSMNYFFPNQEIISKHQTSVESSGKIIQLKNTIRTKKPELNWTSVYKQTLAKCPDLLDLKLKDILLGGWRKYQQVENFLEQGKLNPEVTFTVPLATHTLVSKHHPKIEIRMDEMFLGEIDFELLLKLELTGIILNIKGSEIDGVRAGTCKCIGSLSCEGIPIFEANSQTYDF